MIFLLLMDTSTTESYPYGHPLALHDALPISCTWAPAARPRACWPQRRCVALAVSSRGGCCSAMMTNAAARINGVLRIWTRSMISMRSEEHTSELQPLMRNSYAVFCLKQKNNYNYTNTDNCNLS